MATGPLRYIGLMSGTSMDGVDAGLLSIGSGFELELGVTRPYPDKLGRRLRTLVEHPDQVCLDELGELDTALGQVFAEAALALIDEAGLDAAQVTAIGSHGQTIRHQPHGAYPFTMQLGDPHVIAARTGIATVADFRRRDVALGGQGAPLAPAFHKAAFASPDEQRVVVNIGGMSNVTILDTDDSVTGFDTGPGNVLMDEWCRLHRGSDFDEDGAWARSGSVDQTLLDQLETEPFFSRPPPKSTGRELFNLPWLTAQQLTMQHSVSLADVQATVCELTARTISAAVQRYAPTARRCLVCGGGARNGYLMERLEARLDGTIVEPTDAQGLSARWVEAAAFAWLAWRTMDAQTGNLPAVTGATKATVLGAIVPASS